MVDTGRIKSFWTILISQSVPLNPGGQRHSYEAIPSWHVPPLLQGLSLQSSISGTSNAGLCLRYIFISSHIKTIRINQFTRTCTTTISNEPMDTIASKRVYSIDTFSSIVARAFFAIVNIYQESNMSALNVFEAMPKMSWCTNNYMNILILQSAPVNPAGQTHL